MIIKLLRKIFFKNCSGCSSQRDSDDRNTRYYESHCHKCNEITCFKEEISWSDTITCLCCRSTSTRDKIIR